MGVMAAAIPGDSFAGEVVVGGLLNFLSIYNILITGRVLLSWVPQVGVRYIRLPFTSSSFVLWLGGAKGGGSRQTGRRFPYTLYLGIFRGHVFASTFSKAVDGYLYKP